MDFLRLKRKLESLFQPFRQASPATFFRNEVKERNPSTAKAVPLPLTR